MAMSNTRRSIIADTQNKGKGKGGFKGSWADQYRIPTEAATPFYIIQSAYNDPDPNSKFYGQPQLYYKYRKHVRKLGEKKIRDTICSAGWNAHTPKPCVGCHYQQDTGDKSLALKDAFAIGIVHLVDYHTHPLIKQGQVKMKNDNSAPLMTATECGGKGCHFCAILQGKRPSLKPGESFFNFDPQTVGWKFGNRRYLDLGKNHLANLGDWDNIVGSVCNGVAVGKDPTLGSEIRQYCKNSLTSESWNCPKCNTAIVDVTSDERDPAEIEKTMVGTYPCPTCREQVYLTEVVSCDATEADPRMPYKPVCGGLVRLTLHDIVCFGIRQGTQTDSRLTLANYLSIDQFGATVHPDKMGGKSFRDYLTELAQPYEFEEVLRPTELHYQAQRLEYPMPPGMQGGQSNAQPPAAMGYAPQQQSFVPVTGAYGAAPAQTYGGPPASAQGGYQSYGTPAPSPYAPAPAQPGQGPAIPGPAPLPGGQSPYYGK